MKTLNVALLPQLASGFELRDCTAIVIDVLRATSVIATALKNGAAKIVACETIEDARRLAAGQGGSGDAPPPALLCGERGGVQIDGFDLGNSPAEYTPDVVRGKTIVMTTTNGTRALAAVNAAPRVIVASLLNLAAVTHHVADENNVLVVCAGTDGEISSEDVLAAGAIVAAIDETQTIESMNDQARIAQHFWNDTTRQGAEASDITKSLDASRGGRNLHKLGYEADIARAANINSIDQVPVRFNHDPIELRLP